MSKESPALSPDQSSSPGSPQARPSLHYKALRAQPQSQKVEAGRWGQFLLIPQGPMKNHRAQCNVPSLGRVWTFLSCSQPAGVIIITAGFHYPWGLLGPLPLVILLVK